MLDFCASITGMLTAMKFTKFEMVVHLGGLEKDLSQMDLSMTIGFSKVNHNSLFVRYDQRKGEMEIIK